jgi:hypothetical protein
MTTTPVEVTVNHIRDLHSGDAILHPNNDGTVSVARDLADAITRGQISAALSRTHVAEDNALGVTEIDALTEAVLRVLEGRS